MIGLLAVVRLPAGVEELGETVLPAGVGAGRTLRLRRRL